MVTLNGRPNITRNGVDLNAVKLPKLEVLDPFDIKPLPGQIRRQFFGIAELAQSILAAGQATPIIVRKISNEKYPFGLIDGERRLKACCTVKRAVIAVIHDGEMDLADVHALSVAANFGRQAHDCMEIAKAVERFRESGKKWREIQAIFGKSSTWVLQHWSLNKLHPDIQNWLVPGAIPILSNGRKKITDEDGSNERTSLGSKRIKARMNFTIALQLVNLPQEEQLKIAKRLVGTNMSLAEARRIVLKQARKKGSFKPSTSPAEWRSSMLSLANRTSNGAGIFNDMKGGEFASIFNGSSKSELTKIYIALQRAEEEIKLICMAVNKEIEKGNPR